MSVILLLAGLGLVTVGAEALVRGSVSLALRAGVSSLFVGLTLVAFGTSAPELGASLTATLRGSTDISVGNVVGSNLFNIAIILGLTAVIRPIHIEFRTIRRDLLVALAAATVPWVSLGFSGVIPRPVGVALFLGLLVYIAFAYRSGRRSSSREERRAREEVVTTLGVGAGAVEPAEAVEPAARDASPTAVNVLFVVGGLALLVFGSRLFVDSAVELARSLGISEMVLGLTLVAAGTSLPELVTSLVAARRGNPDIAVGNVIGSNIFNAFGILGMVSMVKAQTVNPYFVRVDTPLLLLATLALLPVMWTGGRISRLEGAALVVGYGVYTGFLIARG